MTIVISVLLMLVTAFCISETVVSRNKGGSVMDRAMKNQYYADAEQEYVKALKELLTERGYGNSGVMMNYVVDGEGIRSYTVAVHHRRLGRLSNGARQELKEECREIVFSAEGCSVRCNLYG